MRPPAMLFGIPVDDLTMVETLDLLGDLIERGRRDGRTHQIATVNVDFLVNALKDREVHDVLRTADVNLNDGTPVLWTTKALGMGQAERVAGSDLVPQLAARAEARGWRVLLFGSEHDVAERAVDVLRYAHEGLDIAAIGGPVVGNDGAVAADVLVEIESNDPDVLCVALGNPKQERFIAAHRDRLGTPVMIGIGGSLDMLVGDRRRAPVWARRAGAEWVVRALQEPSRLGPRYARDASIFFPELIPHARKVRRSFGTGSFEISVGSTVTMTEASVRATPSQWQIAAAAVQSGQSLAIDAEGLQGLDIRAVAQMVGLIRLARRSDGEAHLVNVSAELRHHMAELQCSDWIAEL